MKHIKISCWYGYSCFSTMKWPSFTIETNFNNINFNLRTISFFVRFFLLYFPVLFKLFIALSCLACAVHQGSAQQTLDELINTVFNNDTQQGSNQFPSGPGPGPNPNPTPNPPPPPPVTSPTSRGNVCSTSKLF